MYFTKKGIASVPAYHYAETGGKSVSREVVNATGPKLLKVVLYHGVAA